MKTLLNKLKTRETLEWCLDTLSLLSVLQYCVYRFLQSTMFNFYYSQSYKLITMGLLLVFGGIRYLYVIAKKWNEKDREERRKFVLFCGLAWLLALPFFYVGWLHDYKNLIFLPICCMCLYDMEAERIFKWFVYTIGTLLVATILCSLSGTVRNIVTPKNNFPSAYGTINSSDFASYITMLSLFFWCNKGDKSDWYWGVFYSAVVVAMTFVVYNMTNSRTALISGCLSTCFIAVEAVEAKCHEKKGDNYLSLKTIKSVAIYIFPLLVIVTVVLSIAYGNQVSWAVRIDQAFSERLKWTWNAIQTYGIKPFGSTIEKMHGMGASIVGYWSAGYTYLDIAYAMLLIRYGWVTTIVFTVIWIWLTIKAIKTNHKSILITLVVLSLHGISEARILDINYNVLLAMPFCALGNKKTEEETIWKNRKQASYTSLSIIISAATCVLYILVLPNVLSWLRSFFSLQGWNKGFLAAYSLVFNTFLVILLYALIKCSVSLIQKFRKKTACILMVVFALLCSTIVCINQTIDSGVKIQGERIKEEKNIIQIIQKASSEPVYAAEASEIYKRSIGGISDHVFSTEELGRNGKGSIIVDKTIEALAITKTGGFYTPISKWSGIYTYDENVVSCLKELGYEWKDFYSEVRHSNTTEAIVLNGMHLHEKPIISGPQAFYTLDMATDQLRGMYEVSFSIELLVASSSDKICTVQIVAEDGEQILHQEDIFIEDFEINNKYNKIIDYYCPERPKVTYGIVVEDNVEILIEDISWRRVS